MGVRRTAVIVRLIPVHPVERFKSIASRCGGGNGLRIADADPVLPEIVHILQLHISEIFRSQPPVLCRKGICTAGRMLGLHRHCRLLLRFQFQKRLGRKVIQHITRLKHFLVVALKLFSRIDSFITEVIRHLGSDITDLRDIKYHISILHLLGNIPVRMGLCACASSSSLSGIEIFTVLVVGCLMAEEIKIESQRRILHPVYLRSGRISRAAIDAAPGACSFVHPFDHRVRRLSLFLFPRCRLVACREMDSGVKLYIHKTVQNFCGILSPPGRNPIKQSHASRVLFNQCAHTRSLISILIQISLITVHAAQHQLGRHRYQVHVLLGRRENRKHKSLPVLCQSA